MSITSEIEKLATLRNRGDLTQKEFEKAKALLLSGEEPLSSSIDSAIDGPSIKKVEEKKWKMQLLVAILWTVSAILSAGSAIIATSPIKILIFVMFTGLAVTHWFLYAKYKMNSNQ